MQGVRDAAGRARDPFPTFVNYELHPMNGPLLLSFLVAIKKNCRVKCDLLVGNIDDVCYIHLNMYLTPGNSNFSSLFSSS